MTSLRRSTVFACALAACAPLTNQGPDASLPDAAPPAVDAASADAAAPNVMLPVEIVRPDASVADAAPLPSNERCASMDEVGLDSLRVLDAPPQVLTYERRAIVPTSDTSGAFCAGRERGDAHNDAHVKFTAPRGGLWRLIAEGEGLRSMLVVRRCETAFGSACVEQQSALAGAQLRTSLSAELDVQQGESFEIALDGCEPGARCEWTVRAERWDRLRCASGGEGPPCGESQRCAVDAGGQRFVCEDVILASRVEDLEIERAEALVDRASGSLLVDARYAGPVVGRASLIVDRWHMEDRAEQLPTTRLLASEALDRGRWSVVLDAIDPRAVGAALWFSTDRATIRRTVRFAPWSRPALGQRCSDDPRDRCAPGAICEEGVCRAAAPSIRLASAWSDRRQPSLGLRVTGVAAPRQTLWLQLESRVGDAPWRAAPYRVAVSGASAIDPRFEWEQRELDAPANATEVRVTLQDLAGRTIDQRAAPVQRKRVVGLAIDCASAELQCDEGLACARDSHGARCRPAIASPTACSAPAALRWRPIGDRARVSGVGYGAGTAIDASMACTSPVDARDVRVSFVAPADGRYRFVGRSVAELVATRSCDESVCVRGGWGEVTLIERTMTAGEPWLFSVRPQQRSGEFSVEMQREPSP